MTPWPQMPIRRASVNSFGYGGANAHCVLDHIHSIVPGYQLGGQKRRRPAVSGLHKNTSTPLSCRMNGGVMTNGVACHPTNGLNYCTKKVMVTNSQAISKDPVEFTGNPAAETRRLVLLPVSGHNEHSLKANISATADMVDDYCLADLAYTLSSRRSRYFHRGYALVDASIPKPLLDIDATTCGKIPSSKFQRIGFVFTGTH